MFIRDIDWPVVFFYWMLFSDLGIRVILASYNEFGSGLTFSWFWKHLRKIDIIVLKIFGIIS